MQSCEICAVCFVPRRYLNLIAFHLHSVFALSSYKLLQVIGISQLDTKKIFDAFVTIDFDGSGVVSFGEFHRYFHFGWNHSYFTERIFDMYLQDEKGLTFEQFILCIWNLCSYDKEMMARYLFNIFDIDRVEEISLHEVDAMMRLIFSTNICQQFKDAMACIQDHCKNEELISLDSFVGLVISTPSILKPVFDYQARMIERTTGSSSAKWDEYRNKRRQKFGSNELLDIEYDGNIMKNAAMPRR